MSIEITNSGPVMLSSDRSDSLKSFFRQNHYLKIENLISSDFLNQIVPNLLESEFREFRHPTNSNELKLRRDYKLDRLDFIFNNPLLFKQLEEVMDCKGMQSFEGRIYRCVSGEQHYDTWHSDVNGSNLLAMSLNLSPQIYSGGILKIRERSSKKIIAEIANHNYGGAVFFKIDSRFEHMITEVSGEADKIAYAGWFNRDPGIMRQFV